MLRSDPGPSSEFSGMGKSPVTMETPRPRVASSSRAASTSSREESTPTWEARMQTAW